MSESLRSEWLSYLEKVIPADSGSTQVIESRRAFYAGARAMFGLVHMLSTDDEAQAEKLYLMLDAELDDFKRTVGTPEELQACLPSSKTPNG